MNRPVSFVWVDVFAEQPFGGNPLAVLDGSSIPEEALIELARELSLSEMTFFYPPTHPEADARVRIFTQAKEIPFAGHPVLGTAFALLQNGTLTWRAPRTTVRLQLGLGVVPVTVEGGDKPERARFAHDRIGVKPPPITDERLAWLPPALGLASDRLSAAPPGVSQGNSERLLHPQVVNGGALQLVVPLRSAADVDAIESSYRDVVVAERMLGAELGIMAFAFADPLRDARRPDQPLRVRARFFASDAPQEDPATGSAAAALAVYLQHHHVLGSNQTVEIDQGPPRGRVEGAPGRRSLLRAQCDGKNVQVEGRVREVLRGTISLTL